MDPLNPLTPNDPNQTNVPSPEPTPVIQPQPAIISPDMSQQPAVVSPTVPGDSTQITPLEPSVTAPPTPSPTQEVPQPAAFFQQPQQPIQPQPAYNAIPGSQQSQTKTPAKSRTLLIIGSVVVAIIIVGGGVAFGVKALKKPITFADIQKAENISSTIDNDLSDTSEALTSATDASTADDVNAKLTTASAKLSAAESQYTLLKKSPVLGDTNVKQSFDAIDKKWGAYTTYISDNISDLKALNVPLTTLETSLNTLASSAPTSSSELATYLSTFKSTLTTTTQQASTLKLKITTNQKELDGLRTFLESSTAAVNKAQTDLASGNDIAVDDDLASIDDAQTTFDSADSKIETQADTQQKQLDVSDQFNSFLNALAKLSEKTKK